MPSQAPRLPLQIIPTLWYLNQQDYHYKSFSQRDISITNITTTNQFHTVASQSPRLQLQIKHIDSQHNNIPTIIPSKL